MCTTVNANRTARLIKKFEDREFIYVYKVVRVALEKRKKLHSTIYLYEWKPGWNKSDSKARILKTKNGQKISCGFHCFLRDVTGHGYSGKVIKLRAYKEDFLGAGRGVAVFKRLYLPKSEYSRAIGETTNKVFA